MRIEQSASLRPGPAVAEPDPCPDAEKRTMAQLMFVSETGMFHCACRCTWAARVEWYGFQPRQHRAPAGAGKVDRSDRTASVNHTLTFAVADALLQTAIAKVARDYAPKTYIVTVCDCVSFTADVARAVGLRVPAINITPFGFLAALALWNPHLSKT